MSALHRWIAGVVVVAVIFSCRETSSDPNAPPVVADGAMHQARFSASNAPRQFRVNGAKSAGTTRTGAAATYGTGGSFWAYTDRDASITVDAQGPDGSWHQYVTLTVPRGGLLRRPDNTLFGFRDSTQITLNVSEQDLTLQLEPSGLTFNPLIPARLSIYYGDADPDMNADGVVDQRDDYITQVLLGVRSQQSATDPWSIVPSTSDIVARQLWVDLQHFTGYAVAW